MLCAICLTLLIETLEEVWDEDDAAISSLKHFETGTSQPHATGPNKIATQ